MTRPQTLAFGLIYKESSQWGAPLESSGVPTGCALFPGDSTIRAFFRKLR